MTTETQAREAIVTICRQLYEKGYLAATDGNVSARLGDRLLVTPSGVSKARLAPEDLILTDLDGAPLEGGAKPSSEMAMHVCAYRERPDVQAVVHAHPPRAIAFTVAGVEIPGKMLPEVVVTLGGKIPTLPYTTPTTDEVPRALAPVIADHDVVMMEFHGAICVGKDLWDAYFKMEKLEHNCEVALFALQLGSMRQLSPHQLEGLYALRERMYGAGC